MKNDLVSIIVPIYNGEKFLNRCLLSLLSQTYNNLQVILINDGSIDSSDKLCQKFADSDSRILYLKKSNTGVSDTRNLGIKSAVGQYLMFVDVDDYIEKDYVEKLVNYARNNKLDLVKSGYQLISVNGDTKQINHCTNEDCILSNKNYNVFFKESCWGYVWGNLIKKNLVIDNHILFNKNIKFAEDLLFMIELFNNTDRIGYIHNVGYCYYDNGQSMTKKSDITIRIKECYDNIEVYSKFYNYIDESDIVTCKICSRLNMKLKYLVRTNLNINYKDFKKIYLSLFYQTDMKNIKNKFNFFNNKFDSKYNNFLIYLLCNSHPFIYFVLIKYYYILIER